MSNTSNEHIISASNKHYYLNSCGGYFSFASETLCKLKKHAYIPFLRTFSKNEWISNIILHVHGDVGSRA